MGYESEYNIRAVIGAIARGSLCTGCAACTAVSSIPVDCRCFFFSTSHLISVTPLLCVTIDGFFFFLDFKRIVFFFLCARVFFN